MTDRHLVTVWNPAYATNALEEHLRVLLDQAAAYDANMATDDDVHVWWGKVRSTNRMAPAAHLDAVREIGTALDNGAANEVVLYLTDYRSLYAGEVDEIRVGGDAPASNVPAYYVAQDLLCDAWFRLRDIRRLVVDDTIAVVEELKRLANVHYHDRPVSIYGGMVDLPLVVTRPDGRRFFDPDERDQLIEGRLWAEFDAEEGTGVGAIERTLRDDLLGERAWGALDVAARSFLASAERTYRDHRTDPSFDFGPVLTAFSKALEVQANVVLRAALPRIPERARLAKLGDRTVKLGDRALSLGQLGAAIGGERALNEALTRVLINGGWFTGAFPALAEDFAQVRNAGTHATRVDRITAQGWRNRLLGVGCTGDFVELARVALRPGP